MADNRISLKDPKVTKALAEKKGKLMTITGVYSGGDIINRLDGEALARDIEFQKHQMNRKFLKTDPYFKFSLSEVTQQIVDKDVAEKWLNQQIFKDSEGVKRITVETMNGFAIGYKNDHGGITPIKRESIEGKHFAYGQNVTITFAVYVPKSTGEPTIGFENIFFDEKPKFYIPRGSDLIGTNEVQGWELEPEDLSDEEGTEIPEVDDFEETATAKPESSNDDLWDSDWE